MQLRFFHALGSRRIGGFLVISKDSQGPFRIRTERIPAGSFPGGNPNCGRTIKSRESGSHGICTAQNILTIRKIPPDKSEGIFL